MSLINYTTSSNKRILKSSAQPIAQRVRKMDLFGGLFYVKNPLPPSFEQNRLSHLLFLFNDVALSKNLQM